MLTETWLYSNGDEAYIAAMTPAGYEFRSFPRTGSRGGGIGFVTRTTMSACISFKLLITDRLKQWKCGFYWIMSLLFLCVCIDRHLVNATN